MLATKTERLGDIAPERILRIDPYRRGTGLATEACETQEEIAKFIAANGDMLMTWEGRYWHNTERQAKWTVVIVLVRP